MSCPPSICGDPSEESNSTVPTVAIPIRLVFTGSSESEASGSIIVTPQQRRRRPSHGLPAQHPHRNRRKVSAPPELQAHLGIHVPSITHSSFDTHSNTGVSNPEPAGEIANSGKELIINLTGAKLLSDGLTSGSDSGVPSEYSSWTAHGSSLQPYDTSPFEDNQPRSTNSSLEDLTAESNAQSRDFSDSDDESIRCSSPPVSHLSEGITSAYINTEQRALILPVSASPPPLLRSSTDSNLIGSQLTMASNVQGRQRTNSMVFQLNVASPGPGTSNTLPNARSVSMMSLNTSTHCIPAQISYPSLCAFNNDNQSLYSEAGNNLGTGFLSSNLSSHARGSHASLSGVGLKLGDGAASTFSAPNTNDTRDIDEPQPTDPTVKKHWLVNTLTTNLSTMYAIFLFMLGCVLYLADTFSGHTSAMAETFNVYLIVIQLLWLAYIHVDVRRYINKISQALMEAHDKEESKSEAFHFEPTSDGHLQLRINLPEQKKVVPQYYGFTSGRHGGSLYLKIGAAVFCLGHLIHTGLNLGQKILYLTSDDLAFEDCTCAQDVLMSVLLPIHAFYQLFFIFKYSNLIINKRRKLSRFALMHCISSSLCFWVYTILQETLQALHSKKMGFVDNITTTASPLVSSTFSSDDDSEEIMDDIKPEPSPSDAYDVYSATRWEISYGCEKSTELTKMINETTPYLFPFSIEYNILIVGVWILLWENIGRMERHTHLPSVEMTYEDDNTKGFTSNFIIYVDCHSSNRGLFAGLLLTVSTVISIILFFIFTSSENSKQNGLQVNGYSELIVLVIMIATALFSYFKIRHLDVMKHSVSNVDDILLYICLPCIFLFSVFSMVPAITYNKPLFVAVSLVQICQVVIQTALICDGLRRCSNSSSLHQQKPGRELVTFLVVANVALWLLETFEIKSKEGNYFKYEYYGQTLWTVLSHMTLPLALFFRFHSSVCLVDIWKAGYEPEPDHGL